MIQDLGKLVVALAVLTGAGWAQVPVHPANAKGHTTVTGCLSGPDSDNQYTLTSMQYRTGVAVAGSEELKSAAGSKVKLTGSWEALPGSEGKTGDAAKRFEATEVAVMDEKCQAPQAVTPMSKKKQKQQQQQPKQ
jgi:hypothetical protein